MGVRFGYKSSRPFEVQELLQILETIRTGFADVRELEAYDIQLGGFKVKKRLPPLEVPEGVRMSTVDVSAKMSTDAWSPALAREMLSRCEQRWPGTGVLGVYCQHVDNDAEYRVGGPLREIGAETTKGARSVSYSACAGRIWRDIAYRQRFFIRMIDRLGLPMRVTDTPEGYLLDHTAGGRLWLSMGGRGNHKIFRCEMPGASIDKLVELLEVFREELLDGRIIGYHWSYGNAVEDPSRPNLGKELYDWLVAADFPLQSASVEFGCGLVDLRGLEGLKALCGSKGQFLSTLWNFELPSGERADLDVWTRSNGHYLELKLPLPECLPEVQRVLKLPLQKRPTVL